MLTYLNSISTMHSYMVDKVLSVYLRDKISVNFVNDENFVKKLVKLHISLLLVEAVKCLEFCE